MIKTKSTLITELHEYVVTKAADESLSKRARLYRALALVVGSEKDSRHLNTLAANCETLESDCRQLALNFGKEPQR